VPEAYLQQLKTQLKYLSAKLMCNQKQASICLFTNLFFCGKLEIIYYQERRRSSRHTRSGKSLSIATKYNELREKMKNQFLELIRFTTTLTIISFSSGLLSAIISVSATNALSAIRLEPSALYRMPFFSKNQTNRNAAMRLFPSEKE
jgi:hypothetical protein